MNEWMKKEWMLEQLERIWLDSKDNELYQLIEGKDNYLIEDNGYFERLFLTATIDFDHDIQITSLWGCDPTPEALLAGFIFKVVKAIAECFKGIDVRKKLYKLFLNNSIDLYFSPIGLGEVDKEISKNDYLKITAEEDDGFDYSLPLAEFIKKYTEMGLPKSE